MFTASGYHEGVQTAGSCRFYDLTLYPVTRELIEGASIGETGYTEWVCRGCGAKLYTNGWPG